jgi:hypothetical protein
MVSRPNSSPELSTGCDIAGGLTGSLLAHDGSGTAGCKGVAAVKAAVKGSGVFVLDKTGGKW